MAVDLDPLIFALDHELLLLRGKFEPGGVDMIGIDRARVDETGAIDPQLGPLSGASARAAPQ